MTAGELNLYQKSDRVDRRSNLKSVERLNLTLTRAETARETVFGGNYGSLANDNQVSLWGYPTLLAQRLLRHQST